MRSILRRPALFLLLALALTLLTACRAPVRPTPDATRPPALLLVSIDGFRADYLDPTATPTLAAIAAEGVRARTLRPSFPSLTFPNHYTLVTGLVPDHHGVVHNTMIDAQIDQVFRLSSREAVENPRWWEGGEPIWNTARRAGLRSATMFWPGSEAPVHGHHPHHWRSFDMTLPPKARVAQVLGWLDLPPDQRPDFLTLYFDQVDHEAHLHGPQSEQAQAAVRRIDAALADLVDGLQRRGLWERINLVVVSDHGMTDTPADQVIVLDRILPEGSFELVNRGAVAGIEPRPGMEATLAAALSRPIQHAQCWPKAQVPERFRFGSHPRIPSWVCLADEGWTLLDSAQLARYPVNPGAHGFDPALPSMAALFLAHGPDFRHGLVVDAFDNVDVYPLLARLLRITPEPNDGNPATTQPMLREPRNAIHHSRQHAADQATASQSNH